jgi:hypothetical protein
MSKSPWTGPDPKPGDLDAEIDAMDPRDIQVLPGNPEAKVTVLPGMNDEETKRLVELAVERGKSVREVLAELVRNA